MIDQLGIPCSIPSYCFMSRQKLLVLDLCLGIPSSQVQTKRGARPLIGPSSTLFSSRCGPKAMQSRLPLNLLRCIEGARRNAVAPEMPRSFHHTPYDREWEKRANSIPLLQLPRSGTGKGWHRKQDRISFVDSLSPLSSTDVSSSKLMASVSPSPRSTRKEKLASSSPSPSPPPPPRTSGLHEDRRRRPSPGRDTGWLVDDACVHDLEQFAQTLNGIKAKGVRPELLGSILSHYASRWLPELSGRASSAAADPAPESPTAAWLKKRFYVETLASVIPAEKGFLPCDFLLRLLRAASTVGAEQACQRELEARVAAQLDEASLRELMIPAFIHTSGTLLDVGLVLRLVRGFADDGVGVGGAAMARVAKLVDSYLAEAALDVGFTVAEFVDLASALPAHARAMDDGLYRAIDTYIKAHPGASKQERKTLCRLIDARKLSSEAAHHAAQNDRLPVRSVIQVLFSEHARLNRLASVDWSGSLLGGGGGGGANLMLDTPGGPRCASKREALLSQQQEVRRLRDDVSRLQLHCHALQAQLDGLGGGASAAASEAKRRRPGLLRWSASFLFRSGARAGSETTEKVAAESEDVSTEEAVQAAVRKQGRRLAKARSTSTPAEFRSSLS